MYLNIKKLNQKKILSIRIIIYKKIELHEIKIEIRIYYHSLIHMNYIYYK
jgi:hypothetical protein